MHIRTKCPKRAAFRPLLWMVEPYVGLVICPLCDNVEVWWPGGRMSMSVSAWVVWVEETIRSTELTNDDPPPPAGPRDELDRKIARMIDEAHEERRKRGNQRRPS
jgi:hypothetical protein